MGASTLHSIPLTRVLTSVPSQPITSSHTQLHPIRRGRISISTTLRSTKTSLRASASLGGGGGGFHARGFGDGDGDGGSDSEVLTTTAAAGGIVDEVSDVDAEVIVLDVIGMMCGGCASSVKRILESQPTVSSASVDLAENTATIWPEADAKEETEWRKLLGQALATHLSNCGFQSSIRG